MNINESAPITIVLIFIIGHIGYSVFKFIKIPAPALTGSLVANAIVTSLGVKWADVPILVIVFLQAMIGIMMGVRFSKDRIKQIKKLAFPGLLVALWMVVFGLFLGSFISKFTKLDIGTALFGAVPGGMTEMSVLAIMYKLDVPKVILFQFLRVVVIYFSVPLMASYAYKNAPKAKEQRLKKDGSIKNSGNDEYNVIVTLSMGLIAGYVAWKLNIPAGAIIGPLIVVGGLRSYGVRLKALPKQSIVFTQVGLGAFLGLTFTPSVASTLIEMVWISVIFTFFTTANGFALGYVMHRIFKWDLITSLLACASAGISQMSSIALEMDADAVVVSVIQTIRLIVIILILPPIIIHIIG